MIKAIFFDIDGTLLSFKTHQVPESTLQAFQLLKEKNIKVFVSTGRSYNQLGHIRYLDFDGYITFNGGYCVTKEQEVIYKNNIPQKDIRSLLDYAKKREDLTFSFMSEKEISLNHDQSLVASSSPSSSFLNSLRATSIISSFSLASVL